MYLKICAAIVLMQISISIAFAVDDKKTPQPGGLLQGTPEEQAACAPDSTKFCRDLNSRHAARAVVPARTSQTTQEGVP